MNLSIRLPRATFPILLAAVSLPLAAQNTQVQDMDPKAHPHFEVATIKPTPPDDQNAGFHTDGERIWIENESMATIVASAFGLHKRQIINAPDWLNIEHFDIRGMADIKGQPNGKQQSEMLTALLQERLGLKVHHEKRDLARFVLQAPHGSGKFTPSAHASDNLPDQTGHSDASKQDWGFTNNSMKDFAGFLQDVVDRPVVNETGLTGTYDFRLKWANDDVPAGADTGGLPGLLTAISEQLGLSFKSDHGPTDVLIIDHIEKPSAN